jgi:hypothetical protein
MVTAPDAEPRLMTVHSKDSFTAIPAGIPPSMRVPVGRVAATAVALVSVMMRVRSCATVRVPVAVRAVGVG